MPAIHVGSEDHRLASGKASRKENKKKEKNPKNLQASPPGHDWGHVKFFAIFLKILIMRTANDPRGGHFR